VWDFDWRCAGDQFEDRQRHGEAESAARALVALEANEPDLVLSGKIYVSENMSAHIPEVFSGGQTPPHRSSIENLSDREFEVFELIGEGLSTRQFAGRLHLSAKTVDAHRANIKEKLKMKTSAELISFAARWIAYRPGAKQMES
jgi:DNA-binding NarL/FixJ family response regulator